MDYDILHHKKEQLAKICNRIPLETLESYEKSFDVEYAHNSTAIEGNTMTPRPDESNPGRRKDASGNRGNGRCHGGGPSGRVPFCQQ